MISIDCLVMGILANNVYIVSDGLSAFVVDPSAKADLIKEHLGGLKLEGIVCTHYHSDHTGALAELKQKTGAPVYISVEDAPFVEKPEKVGTSPIPLHESCEIDVRVSDGDVLKFGSMEVRVIATPGHSLGSICLFLESGANEIEVTAPAQGAESSTMNIGSRPILFSGDTLFAGCTGRTDFKGGSMSDMAESMQKLSKLPDDTAVFPGHNDFTSIEVERVRTFPRWGVM